MAIAGDVTGPAPDAATAEGELKPPFSVKFIYGFGQMIESGYLTVASFVFFYYTAVLGLSGGLVGLALAISMAVDAVFDPLIGSISDNVRSKFGRRLPLMVLGAPLMALSLGLLFAPPAALAPFLLFGWLTGSKLALRGFASMFNLPYFALGAEMADGYVERSSIVAFRTFAGIAAGLLINVLAYMVFFAGPGGLQRAEAYPAFGWTVAGLCFVSAAICCLGIWRYAARLPQPLTPPKSLVHSLIPEVIEIFRNPSFRVLFTSILLTSAAAGLTAALNSHAYVFVWKVAPETILFITLAYLFGIAVGVPITPLLLRRMEKRSAVVLGLGFVIVGWTVLPGLRAAGLYAPTGTDALGALMLNASWIGIGSGFFAIAYPSMMADAADDHEVRFGTRREGMYFAGLGFAGKAATGLGALIAGEALDWMNFPQDAGRQINAVLPEHMLAQLILAWGPAAAVIGIVSLVMLLPYGITRERHVVIAATLKAKRALDVSEGRSS
ncbi:MFS transporter [uncultured Phenylobacterium sp.]|uniref:MFS transporter n=1 Tax=uncultured Phenylobacterium sp. TaxID=349273 RepID=UPI0025CE9A85|nr:MFS transporter [uncultured Phenylobacterium sp.]